MPLPIGGEISAGQINQEFGRSFGSYFELWTARNGGYGGINDASGRRPTANGQSGYAFSDWWGYFHFASRPNVYAFLWESAVDVNLRFYKWNPYGGNEISEAWFFGNTGPWTDVGSTFGSPMRVGDRVQVLWNWFGWGNPNKGVFKYIDSNVRGVIVNYGCDAAQIQRVIEFNLLNGEQVYVYGVDPYC